MDGELSILVIIILVRMLISAVDGHFSPSPVITIDLLQILLQILHGGTISMRTIGNLRFAMNTRNNHQGTYKPNARQCYSCGFLRGSFPPPIGLGRPIFNCRFPLRPHPWTKHRKLKITKTTHRRAGRRDHPLTFCGGNTSDQR